MTSLRNWILRTAILCFYSIGFAQAQSDDENAIQRYTEQARSALATGHFEAAEQAFEKLRELEPGVPEVHANLGAIYFQEKKFDKAVPALR